MNSTEYTKLLNEFRKLSAKVNGITKQVRLMRNILEGPELTNGKFELVKLDDLLEVLEENNLKLNSKMTHHNDIRKSGKIYNK
jgi:hypothetical protein